jgi:hypothetical protein
LTTLRGISRGVATILDAPTPRVRCAVDCERMPMEGAKENPEARGSTKAHPRRISDLIEAVPHSHFLNLQVRPPNHALDVRGDRK